jgi:hypothetical protein
MRRWLPMGGLAMALLLTALSPLEADLLEGSASISGRVYIDLDNNGIRSPWERGIAGVQVCLSFSANDIEYQLTAWTDSGGLYRFADLPIYYGSDSVRYTLWEIQPDDYIDGRESIVDAWGTTVMGPNPNDRFNGISLAGIEESPAKGYYFGEWGLKPGRISKAHFIPHTPEPGVWMLAATACAVFLGRRRRAG